MADERTYDVVVIGAGMAGLAAARTLAEAGRKVIVVEAQERIGGRILTVFDGEVPVELGAEFVHGRPPELFALIAEAGLTTFERTGDFLLRTSDGFTSMDDDDGDDDPLEKLKEFRGPDCSFAEYIAPLGLSEEERHQQLAFVEGFNAADAAEVSALALGRQQVAEDAIEGDRSWRIVEGYARLPEFLCERMCAAGGAVEPGAAVSRVVWSPGSAEVVCADGRLFRAAKVVITIPLSLLQADAIRFEPPLPEMAQAASRLRMGDACRFTLLFTEPLWPDEMSFLMTPESMPRVWWTAHPLEGHTLTGWVGGPGASELLGLPREQLVERAVGAVAAALGRDEDDVRSALIGFHTHNWREDRWSRGAYTWVAVGGLAASAVLAEPVGGTLYFAGEHTDTTGHWGTVHAALRSGLRAAKQIVDAD